MAQKEIIRLTPAEARRLEAIKHRYREEARRKFEERVAYYHPLTGGTYTSITIRDQKSRWGSCSSRGTLSFNYRLIFAPPIILDYVVVHELCHLTFMDHSKNFWNKVASVMPDYKNHRQWLKDHVQELTPEHHLEKLGISIKLD
ncbi:MAG: M48 family metallopeptidase [Acetatifactor sp.]|nr:M48 family metallopeptidase [Acetatifactor sp.]